jgi:flagellar protein FliS
LRQYNALDGLLAQLQSTSNFLNQQLSKLPGIALLDKDSPFTEIEMSMAGLSSYRNMTAYGGLADASPHRVIQVMLDGALARIAEASGHLQRGEVAAKGEKIGKALKIIEALLLGLDTARGGEIAANLERVYDYASRTLLKANAANDASLLDEVSALLREIKLGWDGIAGAA